MLNITWKQFATHRSLNTSGGQSKCPFQCWGCVNVGRTSSLTDTDVSLLLAQSMFTSAGFDKTMFITWLRKLTVHSLLIRKLIKTIEIWKTRLKYFSFKTFGNFYEIAAFRARTIQCRNFFEPERVRQVETVSTSRISLSHVVFNQTINPPTVPCQTHWAKRMRTNLIKRDKNTFFFSQRFSLFSSVSALFISHTKGSEKYQRNLTKEMEERENSKLN